MPDESFLMALDSAQPLPEPNERIRLRRALGVRQIELARAVGVSPQAVWAWERGKSEPTGDNRRRYGALLTEMRARLKEAGHGG